MIGYERRRGRDIHTLEDQTPVVGLFLNKDSLEFIVNCLPERDGFTETLANLLGLIEGHGQES